jgi:hypothetical protein
LAAKDGTLVHPGTAHLAVRVLHRSPLEPTYILMSR